MYVPEGGMIYFGNKVPAGIFGYLRNNGNISMQQNAQLYFLGKIWMNESKATMTDESTTKNSTKGGVVHFYQPNPLYGNVGQQILHSGYNDSLQTGPSFSRVNVDNNAGVIITSDANILGEINFRRGHVYMNNYNVVMGDSFATGTISGYDQSRYFVTGSQAKGGYLKYRMLPAGAMADFPVGPTKKIYSPLQMLNNGGRDAFYARAFENVYANATTGPILQDSTLQITWHLGKAMPDNGDVLVTLQHNETDEDPVFRAHRMGSYVSLYDGNGKWDQPFVPANPQTPGGITSSFPISSAMMNTRKFTLKKEALYLTKRVTKGRKAITVVNVFSPNGDNINDTWIVKGLNEYLNCRVEIYNRYGQMIFQSFGYQRPWDGTFKGKPMPVGTYYYIINLTPGDKPLSGSVTILR